MLKIRLLFEQLFLTRYRLPEDKTMITILRGLDENYHRIFSKLIEKNLFEKIIMDDTKVLLLTYESRLEKKKCFYLPFTISQSQSQEQYKLNHYGLRTTYEKLYSFHSI